jgi:hypothetical protein
MVRAGVLYPISRQVNGTQVSHGTEIRVGGEMFF